MVLDVLCVGIRESRRVVVGSGERAYPAPRAFIVGRNRDEPTEARVPRSKTAEESLLHRFGRSLTGDSLISPRWGAKRGVGTPLLGVHRRSGRRWTRATLKKAMHNHGEESSPRFCIAFRR